MTESRDIAEQCQHPWLQWLVQIEQPRSSGAEIICEQVAVRRELRLRVMRESHLAGGRGSEHATIRARCRRGIDRRHDLVAGFAARPHEQIRSLCVHDARRDGTKHEGASQHPMNIHAANIVGRRTSCNASRAERLNRRATRSPDRCAPRATPGSALPRAPRARARRARSQT